jgi:hypothetical protein
MRVELCLQPHFACKVSVGKIADDCAPDSEINLTGCKRRHRTYHRHRKCQRISVSEWAIDADKGRAKTGSQPDCSVVHHHARLPLSELALFEDV